MKPVLLITILACILISSIVLSQPKNALECSSRYVQNDPNAGHGFAQFCGGSVKGYHIITGKSLETLEENVLKGINSINKWRPFSGVTYDPNQEQYLQIMVNSTFNHPYPD